jgi:glycosyltransferase involved in cell wall biosynthesis
VRVLLITNVYPSPWLPTKGTFNHSLVEAIRRRHDVRVIVPVAWTDRLRARSVPDPAGDAGESFPTYWYTPGVLRSAYAGFLWASIRATVRRVLHELRPDVVIGYWAHPDGEVALRAAREAGVPGVVIVGGSDVLLLTADRARRAAIRRVLLDADRVVTVGPDLQARLAGLGVAPDRVRAFTRGVDLDRFQPGDRGQARHRLGIAAAGPLLLWAGRMVPVKGLEVLLEAFAAVGGGATLALVGDGPLRAALEAQAARLGIGERVRFAGAVPHQALADWYRAADLTVLASRSEGMPNVLLESLACGTPFVATAVGSVPTLVREPRVLAPPGDAAALAAAITGALTEPPALQCYACPAGQDRAAEQLEQVLLEVVEGRAAAATPAA